MDSETRYNSCYHTDFIDYCSWQLLVSLFARCRCLCIHVLKGLCLAAVTCVFVRLSLQTVHSPFNASDLLPGQVAQIFSKINYCTSMTLAGNFCKLIRPGQVAQIFSKINYCTSMTSAGNFL